MTELHPIGNIKGHLIEMALRSQRFCLVMTLLNAKINLGSSTVITDSTGAKVQALAYFPYGATRTNQSFTTPAVNVPYKYTGKELDSTGLYYYAARYYDPTLGRFISPDTIVPSTLDPQALNRYAYAKNNPLLYTDPTGHFGFIPFLIGVAISASVSTVVNVSMAAATGGDLGDAAKSGAITGAITGALCPGGCGPIGGMIAYAAAGAASAAAIGQDPGRGAMYGAAMGAALSVMPNIGFQPFGNSATNWVSNYANQVLNDSLKGAVFGATAAGIQGQDIGQGAWAGALASAGGRQFNNLVGHAVGFTAQCVSLTCQSPTYSSKNGGTFIYEKSGGGAITLGNVVLGPAGISNPNSAVHALYFPHESLHISQGGHLGLTYVPAHGLSLAIGGALAATMPSSYQSWRSFADNAHSLSFLEHAAMGPSASDWLEGK